MRRSCKIGISLSNDLFILAILSVAIYKANTFAHTGTCIVCTPTRTHTMRGKMETKRKQKPENERTKKTLAKPKNPESNNSSSAIYLRELT